MTKLTPQQLTETLAALPNWTLKADTLTRSLKFAGFPQAIAFVNRLAELAEAAGHHPDIDIRYDKVELALTTHDAGGITSADIKMAEKIDDMVGSQNQNPII